MNILGSTQCTFIPQHILQVAKIQRNLPMSVQIEMIEVNSLRAWESCDNVSVNICQHNIKHPFVLWGMWAGELVTLKKVLNGQAITTFQVPMTFEPHSKIHYKGHENFQCSIRG